jgi:hypothetical protein
MRLRAARLLTTLGLVPLCAFAVWRGVDIIRFVNAGRGTGEARAAALRPWVGAPGLASGALEASLTTALDANDAAGARAREEQLAAMLALRPLSSQHWLALAGIRLVAGSPLSEVRAAMAMSLVTGPNEGRVMLARGVFGLVQWEALPDDAHGRIIDDLAEAILESLASDQDIATIRNILAAKTDEVRHDIAALLQAKGVSPPELARLGV